VHPRLKKEVPGERKPVTRDDDDDDDDDDERRVLSDRVGLPPSNVAS
jgi:hypothetical protein